MLLMRKWGVGVLLFVTVVVMVTDFHTGRDVRLVYLLILPVSMAALFNHRVLAFTMAITAPFVRLYFFLPWNESHDLWIGSINASVRSIVLVFIVHFMNRAKLMYEYKQLAETLSLQTRIKKLESVLPICTYCKKYGTTKETMNQSKLICTLSPKRFVVTGFVRTA